MSGLGSYCLTQVVMSLSIIECDNIDDRSSSDKFYPRTKCETPKQDNDRAY